MASVQYIHVQGRKVAYWVFGEHAKGIPIVCLHGGPGMPHDYLEPLAELSDERPVIFYDQLACGLSDHVPDVSVLDVSWFTSELELVRQALGLEQFHLFGHSWGGWLALQYTLDFQPTLASLTICSSPASARDFVLGCAELRAQLPPDIDGVLRAYEELQDYRHPIYQKAVQEFYFRHFCRLRPWPDVVSRSLEKMSVEVYMHMWGPAEFGPVDGVLKDWSVETRVREIQVPALVVCGRYDEARPSYMSRLASGLSGPVEFHVFENSSHLAFWEDKDNFLRVLRSFLRQWDP